VYDDVRKETFRHLVRRPNILAFNRQVILQSYTECAGSQADEMESLLERTFQLLLESAADPHRFDRAMSFIHFEIFRKEDPDFWFNRLYKHYKRYLKPRYRFDKLRAWLAGTRLLDFGCGDGLLSRLIQDNGYQVSMCDVLDYRDQQALALPFRRMADSRSIPFPDHSFDTALLMAVLHHVETNDLLPLLTDLRRVTRRLIVEEDTFDLPPDLDGLPEALSRDDHLRDFIGLSVEDQLRSLMFIDTFGNVIAQGLAQMDIPYNFKPLGEWLALFQAQGWQVVQTLPMGFQANQFNRSCHVWFVLD
jgi:SAM-dependent methyltransferase